MRDCTIGCCAIECRPHVFDEGARFAGAVVHPQEMSQCCVALDIQRVKIKRALEQFSDTIGTAIEPVPASVVIESVREVRVQFHCASKGLAHVRTATRPQILSVSVMRFSERWIQFQRSVGRNARRIDCAEEHLYARKSCLGQCRFGIGLGCIAIVVHRLLQRFKIHVFPFSHLLLVIPAQQHQLIGRGILRRGFGDRLAGFRQYISDYCLGDVQLHIEQFSATTIESLVPDRQTAGAIDELNGDAENIALAPHVALEQMGDTELSCSNLRIRTFLNGRDRG